jgi:hypothetical protein
VVGRDEQDDDYEQASNEVAHLLLVLDIPGGFVWNGVQMAGYVSSGERYRTAIPLR